MSATVAICENVLNTAVDIRNIILQRQWVLLRPNGDIRTSYMYFEQDGSIIGYQHVNETSWDVEGEELLFRHCSGAVTARSGVIKSDADGSHLIVMMREEDASACAHVLVERAEIWDLLRNKSCSDLWSRVQRHPAFRDNCRIDTNGFSLPAISDLEMIEVTQATQGRLADLGINILGPFGIRNLIAIDRRMKRVNLAVHFHGHSFNAVILDQQSRIRGEFNFEGDENIAVIGASASERETQISAVFRYNSAGLFLGRGSSAGQVNFWIEGPGNSVQVGDDFMSSWGVWVRTADSHGLIDLDRGEIINSPKSVVIGSHVWLGQDAIIMPGTTIGGGTVVGARSIVTKSLPACCVAAGAPAKVVRERASWTRKAHPSADEIVDLQRYASTEILNHNWCDRHQDLPVKKV
ncbi:acyltransferase [Rhizobium leucaenae]|uniref:Acetyltransferase-like isoleucine patch superfamily enzyme n=1 Tax=Rhizobium leucaenae TaxID=29450 RepID=A0A7W6ZUI2_9HYPH|nr:acyltransferase [Rhizobium leucaenae]MBB4568989.1 acetyltransferase-like isoleucine patch superfamily enzyme [Rhizobium leucaenae]